jgi:uncharacterized protein (TIGR02452 family)
MSYERRVEIWEDTCRRFAAEHEKRSYIYNTPEGRQVRPVIIRHTNSTSEVKVVPMDCVYAAAAAKALRPDVPICILNMADWKRAGGNVAGGSRAQEEELFRRSDLHKHLHQRYYPMRPLQTVYSRDVLFYRAGPDMDYVLIPEQRYDVISAPALIGPKRSEDGERYAVPEDADLMRDKIRQLFVIAYEQGVDTLILSAWGCGAFYCPPQHTAELFREVLTEFDGLIPHVVFAVLGDNYPIFSQKLLTP